MDREKGSQKQSPEARLLSLSLKFGKAALKAAGVGAVMVGVGVYSSLEWAYKRLIKDDYSSSRFSNLHLKTAVTRTVDGHHMTNRGEKPNRAREQAVVERRRDSDLWSTYRYTRMNTAIGCRMAAESVSENITLAASKVGRDIARTAELAWFMTTGRVIDHQTDDQSGMYKLSPAEIIRSSVEADSLQNRIGGGTSF